MRVAGEPVAELAMYPAARKPYARWLDIARGADWRGFQDVRQHRADADRVGSCYVFNLGGNKFRLIVKIEFATRPGTGGVQVRRLLTHEEYDRGAWKGDC